MNLETVASNASTIAVVLACGGFLWRVVARMLADITARSDDLSNKVDAGFLKIDQRFAKVDEKFAKADAKVDEKFAKVDEKFDRVDARFDRVEGGLGRIEVRVDSLEGRFDSLDNKVDGLAKDHQGRPGIVRISRRDARTFECRCSAAIGERDRDSRMESGCLVVV